MTDLAELLERVKAATGPDRRLDLDICAALGTLEYGPTSRGWTRHPHPELTASVDATLALVERVLPEGWGGSVGFGHEGKQEAWLWGPPLPIGSSFDGDDVEDREVETGEGSTPALALLAALLSALIAQAAQGDVGNSKLTRDA